MNHHLDLTKYWAKNYEIKTNLMQKSEPTGNLPIPNDHEGRGYLVQGEVHIIQLPNIFKSKLKIKKIYQKVSSPF